MLKFVSLGLDEHRQQGQIKCKEHEQLVSKLEINTDHRLVSKSFVRETTGNGIPEFDQALEVKMSLGVSFSPLSLAEPDLVLEGLKATNCCIKGF